MALTAYLPWVAIPAFAQNDDTDVHERWTSAVSLLVNVHHQRVDGTAVSTVRPQGAEGTPFEDDAVLFQPSVGLGIELMAPALTERAGRPQPFLSFDAIHHMGLEIDTVREGSPSGFVLPAVFPGNSTLDESAVGGQGMKTDAEYKSPVLILGVGLGFSFEAFERTFRIKPSVQYLQQRIEMSGVVYDAAGQQRVVDGVLVEQYTLTTLQRRVNRTHHGIGGGIEAEMDVLERPWGIVAVGASVAVHGLLGNRDFEFSARDAAGASATWGGEMDAVIYRGGVEVSCRFFAPWDSK